MSSNQYHLILVSLFYNHPTLEKEEIIKIMMIACKPLPTTTVQESECFFSFIFFKYFKIYSSVIKSLYINEYTEQQYSI